MSRAHICTRLSVKWTVRVDRKQVPSVYHTTIYSVNKSQIWTESPAPLQSGVRERKREREGVEQNQNRTTEVKTALVWKERQKRERERERKTGICPVCLTTAGNSGLLLRQQVCNFWGQREVCVFMCVCETIAVLKVTVNIRNRLSLGKLCKIVIWWYIIKTKIKLFKSKHFKVWPF